MYACVGRARSSVLHGLCFSCSEQGPLPGCAAQAPVAVASVVRNTDARPTVAAGFTSRSSQASLPAGVWDLSRPGTPCPLHWLVDSQPRDCQRSPV